MTITKIYSWFKKNRRLAYFFIVPALLFLSLRIARAFLLASRIERTDAAQIIMFLLSCFLVLLAYVAFRKLFTLFIEFKQRVVGSMIKVRLTLSFLVVTLIPVFLFIGFIYFLMDTGMKAVYHPKIEEALDYSVDILKKRLQKFRKQYAMQAKNYFARRPGYFFVQDIRLGNLNVVHAGRYAKNNTRHLPLIFKTQSVTNASRLSFHYIKEQQRVLLLYNNPGAMNRELMAVLLPNKNKDGAEVVVSALRDYKQIRRLREPMRLALIFIVLLIVVLVTLLVMLAAMRLARYFSYPINALAEGTRRIASGELTYRVADVGSDELNMLVKNFNDMTDELQKSRQRLFHAERIAAWQEVARRLAHEIKNPLTPIKLSAERVLRQTRKGVTDLEQIIEKALPSIICEVDNIRSLVDEFASFSRLPQKRVEDVMINGFVFDIIETFRHAHEAVVFEYDSLAEDQVVSLDPAQFRRVLTNLIQNGINAIGDSDNGKIVITLSCNSGNLVFSVTDNGRGIPDEVGYDIFSPYFSATEGGTGLGLAIVEKIIVDHNGKIWFVTKEGEGSAFFVEIPMHIKEENPDG